MASIFKQQYTAKGKDGEKIKKKSKFWYIDYKGPDGIRKRVKGFKDKTATAQLAAKLEKEAELAEVGIIDKYKEHTKRPLTEHIEDFRVSLQAKGNTAKHVKLVVRRAEKVIEGCKFCFWPDISANKVQRFLLKSKQGDKGIGAQTFNFYIQAIKQFCNWMVQDGRANENPLSHLSKVNVRTDRRHDRRALEPDELRRLLQATESAETRFGMKGHERALLYIFAAETGLRANECRNLTVSSFDFDKLTVTVKAAYSKRKRMDVLPLRKDRALYLKDFFAGKMPNVKAFNMPSENYTAKMLKADLEAVGIEYEDEAGRFVDFHALRHTTGSLLADAGVHPKIAQSLMRHSDINLTMSRYSHIFRGQESEAVETLPDLTLPSKNKQRATGTDNKSVEIAYKPAYKKLTKTAYSGRDQSALIGTDQETGKEMKRNISTAHKCLNEAQLGNKKAPLSLIDNGAKLTEEEGFEPPVHRCTTVFKTATISHSVTPPALLLTRLYIILPTAENPKCTENSA